MSKQWRKWVKSACMGMCVVAAAGLIAGCGGDEKAGGNPEQLTVGVTNFANTLEPTENYFSWVVMRYGLGEALVKFDEKMQPTPWLADKWEISPDKMTWTFHIRDNVKFSNGNPLTAEAVKASIERSFAKNPRAKTFFEYTSMEADGQNLIIHTDKSYPNMPGFLADPLFLIVDVTSEATRNFSTEGPICTGPYTVKSFTKEKAVMERNPNYWGGEVPYQTVVIPSIDDPNTRAMSLQSGDVDMAVNIGAGDIALFRDKKDYQVDEIASLRTVLARINQKGIFGDKRVRDALISGCDREAYNNVLLKGTFIPGKAPVPPSMNFGFDELVDHNSYNPERAKQLLDEAGWVDSNGDGIRDKDGQDLSVRFVVYNSRAELPLYAEAVQADMRKIGMDVKIETVDYNLLDQMGMDGDYDLMISNITTANTGDPEVYLRWYWQTNVDGSNPQNGSGYSNPEYDATLEALSVEFDPMKRRELIIKAQQILLDDSAALFLGYPMTNIVAKSYLDGVKMYPSDYYWVTNLIKPAGK